MAWPLSLQGFLQFRQSLYQRCHCWADLVCRLPRLDVVEGAVLLCLLEAVAWELEVQDQAEDLLLS